ncbi:PRA1 family protein F3-like [Rutidosis leptorrhynchoides]|uniref:PRA1 family protein F3-like n=1 Tax=Rutidosis leptorrhynchoides TaxID=125765 RepID=UPI003A996482
MTTYGTIPTSGSPEPSSDTRYITRANERIRSGLGTRRSWKVMFNFRALGIPSNVPDTLARVRYNVGYFRMNYVIIVLIILFLSLLWHPISLIVFIVMFVAWLFLYFLRDEPLVVFGRTIDDRVVLIVLGVLTIVFLFLTHATVNIIVALCIGITVVVVHGVVRKTEDLEVDEESTGLMATTPGGPSGSSVTSHVQYSPPPN